MSDHFIPPDHDDPQTTTEEQLAEAWEYWHERARKAEAENFRLRQAIRPFAAIDLPEYVPDTATIVLTDLRGGIIDTGPKHQVCAASIRAAKALCEPKP